MALDSKRNYSVMPLAEDGTSLTMCTFV